MGQRTVLIVDDMESSIVALEIALDGIPGIQVAFVSSALEAVRRIQDRGKSISAVVTDLRMPAMDGFELIRFIRSDSARARIPVIVLTADTDPDALERATLLGANAFFAKPFSPKAVRRTLEKLLDATENS